MIFMCIFLKSTFAIVTEHVSFSYMQWSEKLKIKCLTFNIYNDNIIYIGEVK